jgi:hypothetical protein
MSAQQSNCTIISSIHVYISEMSAYPTIHITLRDTGNCILLHYYSLVQNLNECTTKQLHNDVYVSDMSAYPTIQITLRDTGNFL